MKVTHWPSRWSAFASLSDWRGPIFGQQHQMPRGPALAYGREWELLWP